MSSGGGATATENGAAATRDRATRTDGRAWAQRAQRWRRLSDLGQAVAGLAPLVTVLVEAQLTPRAAPSLRREAAAVIRTVLTARLLNTLVKMAAHRPRPGAAGEGCGDQRREEWGRRRLSAAGSFPSGHAATAAAGGVMWARSFCRRHPSSLWRPWVMGAAFGLGGLTAYGRVAGGRHFVSDVACGLALGAAMGWGGAGEAGVRRWRPTS